MKDLRLDKFLTEMGKGSRSQVKTYISKGRVTVNGEIIKRPEYKISPEKDIVNLEGEKVNYSQWEYYMLNKPDGYVSATEDNVYPTVIDLIKEYHPGLFPVGRLDVDTEGLLLITNDGQLAHRLLSPRTHVPKTYYVKVKGRLGIGDVNAFTKGIPLEDFTCMPSYLNIINSDEISECEVTIYEGKFHQVKRMFQACGKEVVYLKRISMGELKLDENLKLGHYRPLTDEEINSIL